MKYEYVSIVIMFHLFVSLGAVLQKPAFLKKNTLYEFSIGSTLPLEGGVSTIGKDFSNGINMVFNQFNKNSVNHGKVIRLFSLDDRYIQIQGQKNIESLLEQNVSLVTGLLQDKVIQVFDTELTNSRLGVWCALSGTAPLYEKQYPLSFNFRASLKREVKGLTTYVVKKKLIDNIVVFYEDSLWGKDGLQYVEKYLKKMNIELKNAFSYPLNTVHIRDAVTAILRVKPVAIICIAHARPTYNLIQEVLSEGLDHCQFFGLSTVAPIQYLLKKSRGIYITMSMVVPDPFYSQAPIVKKYREEMQTYFPYVSLSPYSLEGYIAGKLITHVLKKVPVMSTYAGVMKEFESIKQSIFGGIDCHFDKKKRSLSKAVWIKEKPEEEAIKILE